MSQGGADGLSRPRDVSVYQASEVSEEARSDLRASGDRFVWQLPNKQAVRPSDADIILTWDDDRSRLSVERLDPVDEMWHALISTESSAYHVPGQGPLPETGLVRRLWEIDS